MHLKQVIICGFRSYKDQIAIAPFSSEHNVVIGRNGSGKSNFFDAIRFGLLTARFANLRPDERLALLHEGAGKHVMSAYVEIIFDNSDGRFPIDTEEVILRRTIGVKKDEFFLNRKHITKSDVVHLLESAGFSRSNPYYIVQQGKVNALAVMKETERLALLKEVAGTNVYEERRLESLKIMQEQASRREKIEEVITYIEERLQELEVEKDELNEYQQLDREQRALEYSMHEKELQEIRSDIEILDKKHQDEVIHLQEVQDRHNTAKKKLAVVELSHKNKNDELHFAMSEKKAIEGIRSELMTTRFALETDVTELQETLRRETSKREAWSNELKIVTETVKSKKHELNNIVLPQYQELEQAHRDIRIQIGNCSRESDALIAKQSRTIQFSTQAERDNYLSNEISAVDDLILRKKSEISELNTSIYALETSINEAVNTREQFSRQVNNQRQKIEECRSQMLTLKAQRNSISEERKEKWRAQDQMAFDIRKLTETLHQGENVLHSTMNYDVRKGLDAVRDMQSSNRISGIYGPLIDLIEPIDARFCLALDEAASGSLFHVVVDTDDTATRIMFELEQKNLGRLTFLPLNRLKVQNQLSYPQDADCIPIIDKVIYPATVKAAIISTLGKKLLCKDLDTCTRLAEQFGMDCVTLEGDFVHRRGALQGGYKDSSRSRTRAMMQIRESRNRLDDIEKQSQQLRREAQEADQRVTAIVGDIQKLENDKNQAASEYQRLVDGNMRLQAQIETHQIHITDKQKLLNTMQEELAVLAEKQGRFRSEMASPMSDSLSTEETDALHALSKNIAHLQLQERDLAQKLADLTVQKEAIESTLTQNLERRQKELALALERDIGGLNSQLEDMAISEQRQLLKAKQLDLDDASRNVESHEQRLQQVDERISRMQDELLEDSSTLENMRTEISGLEKELDRESRRNEKRQSQRRRLLQKREEAMRDIRELGTLPLSELEKFQSMGYQDIVKELSDRNKRLQAYSHVNKKALDQYLSFQDQRAVLLDRKRELDEGDRAIQDLIQVLDTQKNEQILRTFKGVAQHFSQVFHELVPTGEGKMLMIRAESEEPIPSANNELEAVEMFVGVQIKVNFRGEGDSYLMQQLSGGQKSLVALAFIFAIQRCDPAPFYLFDEIDQALDATHRAAVAALIRRQSQSNENPAQFITSTFRPELVNVADQFYGIGYQNKISNVSPMTKEESLAFITNIMAEEENVEQS